MSFPLFQYSAQKWKSVHTQPFSIVNLHSYMLRLYETAINSRHNSDMISFFFFTFLNHVVDGCCVQPKLCCVWTDCSHCCVMFSIETAEYGIYTELYNCHRFWASKHRFYLKCYLTVLYKPFEGNIWSTGWLKKMDSVLYVYISWTIHGMWIIYITFERGGPKFSNTTARALA